jgi:hypothetical protein
VTASDQLAPTTRPETSGRRVVVGYDCGPSLAGQFIAEATARDPQLRTSGPSARGQRPEWREALVRYGDVVSSHSVRGGSSRNRKTGILTVRRWFLVTARSVNRRVCSAAFLDGIGAAKITDRVVLPVTAVLRVLQQRSGVEVVAFGSYSVGGLELERCYSVRFARPGQRSTWRRLTIESEECETMCRPKLFTPTLSGIAGLLPLAELSGKRR